MPMIFTEPIKIGAFFKIIIAVDWNVSSLICIDKVCHISLIFIIILSSICKVPDIIFE